MTNFPEIKPGPFVGKVLKFWFERFGEKLDSVDEEELRHVTAEFLKNNHNK
jgi:hypothetical protein